MTYLDTQVPLYGVYRAMCHTQCEHNTELPAPVVSSCKSHEIFIISTMHRLSIVNPNPNTELPTPHILTHRRVYWT